MINDLTKISTHRLLNIFRMTRDSIYGRDQDREYTKYDAEEEEYFTRLKAELDTREHIPRK